MGLFSIFGKNTRPVGTPAEESNASDATQPGNNTAQKTVAPRLNNISRNTTAMKIDAIESEMSTEFIYPVNILNTMPSELAAAEKKLLPNSPNAAKLIAEDINASPSSAKRGNIEVAISDTPAVVEEAAVLFANSQSDLAEQVLLQAIAENDLGNVVWWMLLDLYRISGKQTQFDDLSLDFAHKFETSPPTWDKQLTLSPNSELAQKTSPITAIAFSGKLDGNIIKQIERAQKLSLTHATLRLEFTRITSVDSIGCGLLLRMLKKLQKAGLDLILVGSNELGDSIRAILCVGRRDETTAPWLLLLEILHLLNNQQAFEDVSIDYSITFEVSPPPFISPVTKVTTANDGDAGSVGPMLKNQQQLRMPILIEGRIDDLLLQIKTHAHEHNPALIDCSRLVRVDFNAAGQLANGLLPLTAQGRKIAFYEVNHLVAALFKVMGLHDIVSINTRKN
ncbi:hypothetical protein C7W93_20505 [Glaciimonas sp. PCH181]|nr:hypothetical protein C7W93_20505 [Glaciimonas sp. PCH181]